MKRLLRLLSGPRPYHRRDWRRFWRYCRCGWHWRCPDSVELVPMPYQSPPPIGARMPNRPPRWDEPARPHLGNGRSGGPTPARKHRTRA
ncbi:hypothetical protein [Plantactinospora endophytica]|uniref:Uncharacterized protein n=1 Tax=Plantactinospora endophytica TaxID=673535 RepID=A0ABQ4E947_9ACTN|nr:hypothetical protein [Plantactinospora endophytica]GIG91245.1 hypothetical protein Pen02_61810 [Plantactinospora endophytica]